MRTVLINVGITLALVIVVVGLIFTENTRSTVIKKLPDEAIPYSIQKYEHVDPAVIGYKEVQQIRPGLKKLYGIACSSNNEIYVTGDSRLLILENFGAEILVIDLGREAKCVTVSPDNLIYLGLNNEVRVADETGNIIRSWFIKSENSIITSIAATESDVFVADAINKVVLHFDPYGNLLHRIGEKNPETGRVGFILPSLYFDLAIDAEGFLWVVNPGIHTLENYTFEGELRSSWRKTSFGLDGFSGCCNPTHIAILPDGSFVTSEKGLVRIKIHDRTGTFRTVVAAPNQFQEETVGLDLAVDSAGRVLVLDPKAGLIRVYAKSEGAT